MKDFERGLSGKARLEKMKFGEDEKGFFRFWTNMLKRIIYISIKKMHSIKCPQQPRMTIGQIYFYGGFLLLTCTLTVSRTNSQTTRGVSCTKLEV